jgi:hypothetical protein
MRRGSGTFEGRLLAGDPPISDDDYFGEHVAADAGYFVMGNPTAQMQEPLDPSQSGKLYLFRRSLQGWTQVDALYDYLTPSGPLAGAKVSVLALGPAPEPAHSATDSAALRSFSKTARTTGGQSTTCGPSTSVSRR